MTAPTWEQVEAALKPLWNGGGTTTPQPQPNPQPTTPPGVRVVAVPWKLVVGSQSTRINVGEMVAFAITPPAGFSSNREYCSFTQSPTDGGAYFQRVMCLSDRPGVFDTTLGAAALAYGQETRAYFTVGGRKQLPYNRGDDMRYADLTPGQTYYVNVRQIDPAISCSINYKLTP